MKSWLASIGFHGLVLRCSAAIPSCARSGPWCGRTRSWPIVGLRQIGRTTLAREIARTWQGPATTFDPEGPRAITRLADPTMALGPLRGLVVSDEIQRRPELLPVLRVLSDRDRRPARFLLLRSGSGCGADTPARTSPGPMRRACAGAAT